MVNTRTLQLSFNAGEVSQELYGRIDLKDHQSGLKKCLNMYVKPQGAAKRRPGLQYVGNARSNSLKSRLIPFNSPTPMVLELTQNHMRFYRNGEAIALTGDNYFVARSCTLNTLTGVWTLASGNLDNLANDARVTVYSTTAAGPGALFTDASQGPARIRLIAQSNEWSVTDVAPVVVTQSAHGLRQNDSVVFRESGSSLRWYYVEVIDEFRFKPKIGSVVSPPLSPQQLQDLKLTPKTLFACVTPAPTIALSAHYFIDKLSSTTFRLKTSVGGLPITAYDNAGIGTFTLSAYYAQGSLIFDQGLGNYYQTNGAIFSSSSATATWVNYAINNASATTWSLQATGQGLAHNNNYSDAELMELTYAQDNNRLTIAHRNRPTIILTRTTDLQWSWEYASYSPPMAAPTNLVGTAYGAIRYRVEGAFQPGGGASKTGLATLNSELLPFVPGDTVKCFTSANSGLPAGLHAKVQNNVFTVSKVWRANASPPTDAFEIKSNTQTNLAAAGLGTGEVLSVAPAGVGTTSISPPLFFELWPENSQSTNYYVVTAVDENDVESQPSAQTGVENNLYARETYNVLSWTQVPDPVGGAAIKRYNIYKRTNGLFGWIGQTDTASQVTFRDDNLTPDLGKTVPILDTSLSATNNYPGAVSYFEQRKVIAGTNSTPAKVWMTRSNTEQDLSFSIPIKDSDRISFTMRSRDNHQIRHIVSTGELLILSDQGEWRVTPINSEAITPESVSVRPQSYVGSSFVTPAVINNALVFCAARGGHVRQMGFNFNAQGYTTADLSLRAAHLFDDFTIADLAYMRSPLPIVWFVSSSGKLLGMTYIPEEGIAAWHQHETDGQFESVACIQEGQVDSLYCVVKRTINGTSVRYIERLTDVRANGSAAAYVDSHISFDGTHTGGKLLKLSEYLNGGWSKDAIITVEESLAGSLFAQSDVGDYLEIRSGSDKYRMLVTERLTSSVVRCRLVEDLPVSLWNTTVATWAWARQTFAGATHLANEEVDVVADGVPLMETTVVSASGTLTTSQHYTSIVMGIPYVSQFVTLPLAMQAEAAGQGRTKNINKMWLRVDSTDERFWVGPEAMLTYPLVVENQLPSTATSLERQITLMPEWNQDGSILVHQEHPVGLTINGIVLEVAVGG